MAEAEKEDTGMDMFPGYELPTRSNVTEPTMTKTATSGAGNAGPITTVTHCKYRSSSFAFQ